MCNRSSNFCHNIGYIRKESKISKKEMAQILGISVDTLRKMEAGDPNVRTNAKMLRNLCDYFKLSADAVLRTRLEDTTT